MTKVTDVLSERDLASMIAQGYVKVQRHSSLPLAIYNYTPAAQFDRVWNDTTRRCRGLIVNYETNEVVARPFEKFFNYEELNTAGWDSDATVTVTDKADGSLGITYPRGDGGYGIATRGSFTSEQAVEATLMMDDLYAGWTPPNGVTVLFEIIYPGNRIVLDYGDARELRLIDALWIDRGWPLGSDPNVVAEAINWPGSVVGHLGTVPLKTALSRLVGYRENAEGVVMRFLNTDNRVKMKQADYVALHRVLTKTTARMIWQYLAVNACRDKIDPTQPKHWGSRLGIDPARAQEILAVGDDWLNLMLANVPDEFYRWVEDVIDRVKSDVVDIRHVLEVELNAARDRATDRRSLFAALRASTSTHFGAAMALHDGQDVTTYCWKSAYPGVETPFRTVSEDTA